MAIITASGAYSDFVTVAKSIGDLKSVYYFINTTNPAFEGCFLLAITTNGHYQVRLSLGYGDPGVPTSTQVLTDFPAAKVTLNNLAIE